MRAKFIIVQTRQCLLSFILMSMDSNALIILEHAQNNLKEAQNTHYLNMQLAVNFLPSKII